MRAGDVEDLQSDRTGRRYTGRLLKGEHRDREHGITRRSGRLGRPSNGDGGEAGEVAGEPGRPGAWGPGEPRGKRHSGGW